MIELVIFDCDGVLFSSEPANIAFYNEVLRRVGEPPLADAAEAACHALASAQLFEKYYGGQPDLLARLRETAHAVDYGPYYDLMQPRDGLHELLARLRRRYRTAMATNRGKTTRGVVERFALEPLLDFVIGVLEVERPKPHPDMLLRCAEHFGLSPDRAVYVGDQANDARSAGAAGMHFIAMGTSAGEVEHRVSRLDELPALLDRL